MLCAAAPRTALWTLLERFSGKPVFKAIARWRIIA